MIRTDELPAMRACATKSRSRMLNDLPPDNPGKARPEHQGNGKHNR